MELPYVKLSENAYEPVYASAGAAGMDLRSAYDYVIPRNDRMLVKTDIALQLPKECYGRIAPRSGLALKHGIDISAGVIDSDYTGNVGVVMVNNGDEAFVVLRGDRIAQLILERIFVATPRLVQSLSATERGANGFGSTGK
ncbi:dUTPase [Spodoptera litura granulovirus]|uniref:dUTP diphosphatase n=1 Tax=Spodoptera litura granulovirus TaxID=359919 RepID=A5IZQ3_9BBAC|nr:dUTPase [Spodoptera litura granulovirus]ABQ51994.1 dUTPase [Spodoptera litura granulovirus]